MKKRILLIALLICAFTFVGCSVNNVYDQPSSHSNPGVGSYIPYAEYFYKVTAVDGDSETLEGTLGSMYSGVIDDTVIPSGSRVVAQGINWSSPAMGEGIVRRLGTEDIFPGLLLKLRIVRQETTAGEDGTYYVQAEYAEAGADEYFMFGGTVESHHVVAVTSQGTAVSDGNNDYGQGDLSDWTDITAASAGGIHTLGLKADGSVLAAGGDFFGQCGVGEWTDIIAIAAGGQHSVGLRADGTVVAVGLNNHGQCDVSDWADIVAISAGRHHTVGLRADGTVVAVGDNSNLQCAVEGWTEIARISAGGTVTVGLKSQGDVLITGTGKRLHQNEGGLKKLVALSAADGKVIALRESGLAVEITAGARTYRPTDEWTKLTDIVVGLDIVAALRSDGVAVTSRGTVWTDIVAIG